MCYVQISFSYYKGPQEQTHRRVLCEAILMVAGLIQLPTMIASVVGVRGTKTPSRCDVAAPRHRWAVSSRRGAGFKNEVLKPRSFWHHTHLLSCPCLCLFVVVSGVAWRSRRKRLGPVLALDGTGRRPSQEFVSVEVHHPQKLPGSKALPMEAETHGIQEQDSTDSRPR